MTIQVTMGEVKPLIINVFQADLVPNLISSPGVGKSALAAQIAEMFDLKLIDIRLSYYDPADLNGFPFILDKDAEFVKAGYVPMDVFPIETDPLPAKEWKKNDEGKYILNDLNKRIPVEFYKGWLIIMDEFNSAQQNVQAAAYKVVLDKMVGMHRLHKKVVMMTAGNRATDRAIVNRLSTAMQSRLISFDIKVCDVAWMKWANGIGNIDHRVKSFISFKPELLHKFVPDHDDLTFPCPRTWAFV